MKTMLLAVGGNSLIRAGEKGTIAEQRVNAQRTAAQIAGLIRAGYRIVLTHGNGPQVGAELLRSERGASQVPGLPLDVCGASTQGEIGYLLQQSLESELQLAGLHVPVATVVTQSLVSLDDPSMKHPSKPIGPFYSRADAEERKRLFGWEIVEDAARGYRRVVPSPDPIEIVELEVIRDLVEQDVLVIACGGGGIPVVWMNGKLQGVEAVIDKDLASALLAWRLGADLFVISTDTDCVVSGLQEIYSASVGAGQRIGVRGLREGRPFSAWKHGTENRIRVALFARRREGSHHYFLREPVPGDCRIGWHAHVPRSRARGNRAEAAA